jgi:hypothetical protein
MKVFVCSKKERKIKEKKGKKVFETLPNETILSNTFLRKVFVQKSKSSVGGDCGSLAEMAALLGATMSAQSLYDAELTVKSPICDVN